MDPETAPACLADEIHDFRSDRALYFLYEKDLKENKKLSSLNVKMLEVCMYPESYDFNRVRSLVVSNVGCASSGPSSILTVGL